MPGSSRERGFTMVEVMVALLLTAIAAIGLIGLYVAQTRATSFSRHSSEAAALASDKLEQLRTMGVPTSSSDTVDEKGQPGGIFTRTWTVTTGTTYSDLRVVVTWEDDGQRSLTVFGRRVN